MAERGYEVVDETFTGATVSAQNQAFPACGISVDNKKFPSVKVRLLKYCI